MNVSLNGYVAVITGASSGIGRSTATALLRAGANVVLGARRLARLDALEEEWPERVVAVQTDVRSPEQSASLVTAAIERFGKIDGLIASAGIGMYGGILDGSDEDLRRMLETNIDGTIWPIRSAVRRMDERGRGDIVIISSVAGLRGRENEAVYAATKHAQVGLAGALDRELHRRGIRVTALCPGGVVTEFAMGTGRTPQSPELAEMMSSDDVANAIVTILQQPRGMRSLVYSMRGALEDD